MIKSLIKKAILAGPHRAIQRTKAPCLLIVRYHSIQDDQQRFEHTTPGIMHSTKSFRAQMEYLSRKLTPISLDDVPQMLSGEKHLPRRSFVVTFDDGYRDNLEVAAGILEEYGIRGVFYVTTAAIDGEPLWFCRLRRTMRHHNYNEFLEHSQAMARSNYQERERRLESIGASYQPVGNLDLMMSWEQVRQLQRRGHIVGSHTLTHPNVAHIDAAEAEKEISNSRIRLEKETGMPIKHFSYPHPILEPCHNDMTGGMCRMAGYETAAITTPGTVNAGDSPLTLQRVAVPEDFDEFRWTVERTLTGF